ncbi:MAG TPA: hypothetical protein VLA89_06750 [Gemmatimonadales bacterium]|nr:hypothetical protein [Gemmatimonadales bacterium]
MPDYTDHSRSQEFGDGDEFVVKVDVDWCGQCAYYDIAFGPTERDRIHFQCDHLKMDELMEYLREAEEWRREGA